MNQLHTLHEGLMKTNILLRNRISELEIDIFAKELEWKKKLEYYFKSGYERGSQNIDNDKLNDKSHSDGFDDGYDFGYKEGYDTCLSECYEVIMYTHHLPFNLDKFEDLRSIMTSILKNVKMKQDIIGKIDESWKIYCYPIIKELNKIKTKRTKMVGNLGGFGAEISYNFANDKRFNFINYDYGLSKEKMEDHSVEICILCLAMWGSNCHDYVREAHRILESGGKLYIMEATKRWTSASEADSGQPADKLKKLLEESGFQIVKSSVEKFSLFVCAKA